MERRIYVETDGKTFNGWYEAKHGNVTVRYEAVDAREAHKTVRIISNPLVTARILLRKLVRELGETQHRSP